MRLFKNLAVLGLALTTLNGCADEGETQIVQFGRDMGIITMSGCSASSDCESGNVCVTGNCVPGSCHTDVACPDGMMCDTQLRSCVAMPMDGCQTHRDCPNGFCVDGRCENVQCAEDTHCQAGLSCIENACVPGARDCVDNDGDSFGVGADCPIQDCNDNDANINPNVIEDGQQNCEDNIDNNCDGIVSMCTGTDQDGDGWTVERGDCQDGNEQVNPGREEIPYNQVDDDCNDATSDTDVDGDGYDAEIIGGRDCNDDNRDINPDARDIPGNMIDEDCDGSDRTAGNEDRDMDGQTEADGDCNDGDETVNSMAVEIAYNGKDDDCDPNTRDDDLDNDGVINRDDCDDGTSDRSPNNEEIYYNGIDDDCNAETNDTDKDGDGFDGGPRGADCNDDSAAINPDAEETPYNGEDDDCDPETRDDDLDGDGFPQADDCEDGDETINPGIVEDAMTNCGDGIDHNCRGGDVACAMNVEDADGDGVPDADDCAPENPDIPGPIEIPNNMLDDDCNEATLDACEDDMFDVMSSNSVAEAASVVEDGNTNSIQYGALRLCANDQDWYRIDVQRGDGLEVDLAFNHQDGDIDMALYGLDANGQLVLIDESLSISNSETVWQRRADTNSTYWIKVYRLFANADRVSYGMTVNVFNGCTDDPESNRATGFPGEQNDSREAAVEFPTPGTTRQICDYDEDWYTFELQRQENVRIDTLFTDADGDVDIYLYDAEGEQIARAITFSDNEVIERILDRGTYYVRVKGVGRAQNQYRLFRSAGMSGTVRTTWPGPNRNVPDFADGQPGVLDTNLTFDAPAGAVVRSLRIVDLDINHDYLRDLRVTGLWNGQEVATFWNRQGDADGRDGGEDDDWLPLTGGDINFDNRDYAAFLGRPADGTFTLRIQDLAAADDGELNALVVEIEYLAP